MKALSVILMILLLMVIAIAGLLYFFGFIMSFDAPGSGSDIESWVMRLLFFLPVIVGALMLIFGFTAFRRGHYGRSVMFTGFTLLLAAGFWIYAMISSMSSVRDYQTQRKAEEEMAKQYPVQKFLRPAEGGTDTIIVWPNRIVAYRLYVGTNKPWGGPLGDLNEARDSLRYYERKDTRIRRDELQGFMDDSGRKFTEVYGVR